MYYFSVIFCLLATGCWGSPRIAPRILGGSDANIVDFPFAASIELLDLGHQCGGVIVDTDWVLTDAWCTPDPADVIEYTVRVGSAEAGNGSAHSVTEWIFHPLADAFFGKYDFALVKVDPPFVFDVNVAAAALPDLNQETPDGAVGAVARWGRVDSGLADMVSQLQYANITLAIDANCATLLGEDFNESLLCGQGENNDVAVCWRDEGGPLVVDGTLFGISLWPRICADPLNVQKFGRVAGVRDWIDATIGA